MVVVVVCGLGDGVQQADRLVQDFADEACLAGKGRVQFEDAQEVAVRDGKDWQRRVVFDAVALSEGFLVLSCGAD